MFNVARRLFLIFHQSAQNLTGKAVDGAVGVGAAHADRIAYYPRHSLRISLPVVTRRLFTLRTLNAMKPPSAYFRIVLRVIPRARAASEIL